MKFPEFSVVMAVYRGDTSEYLEQAVVSLLNQTVMPSEIIIIVDGCVHRDIDTALERYTLDSRIRVLRNEINHGLAYSLNRGISIARYDYIARMDSDDICLPFRFEVQLKYLLLNSLDCVGGQVIEFGNDTNHVLNVRRVPLVHEEIVKQMKWKSAFNHPSVVFKKEVFNRVRGYSTTIFPEDLDFFVRLKLFGCRFGNVPEEVLFFRVGVGYRLMLKRRWGLRYAKNELNLYFNYYKNGFYGLHDFLLVSILKIPMRLIPFFIFKFIYVNFRK